jgi:hypothetical protein
VNDRREVFYDGVLAATLTTNGDMVNKPDDHTIRFGGQFPCTQVRGNRLKASGPTRITSVSATRLPCTTGSGEAFERATTRTSSYQKVNEVYVVDPSPGPPLLNLRREFLCAHNAVS